MNKIIFGIIVLSLLVVNGCYNPIKENNIESDLEPRLEIDEEWKVTEVNTIDNLDGDWWKVYVEIVRKECPYTWTNMMVYYNYKTKEIVYDDRGFNYWKQCK